MQPLTLTTGYSATGVSQSQQYQYQCVTVAVVLQHTAYSGIEGSS